MKKIVAALTAGLLLAGGQAAAAGSSPATARIGDRVGAQADASEQFAGVPLPVLLIGGAIVITAIVVIADDDSDSD